MIICKNVLNTILCAVLGDNKEVTTKNPPFLLLGLEVPLPADPIEWVEGERGRFDCMLRSSIDAVNDDGGHDDLPSPEIEVAAT